LFTDYIALPCFLQEHHTAISKEDLLKTADKRKSWDAIGS